LQNAPWTPNEPMANVSDLSLKDRLWYHRYRFRRVDPLPWTEEGPPVSQARVAVVTSAGIHLPGDPPFARVKGGDFSYRWIPGDASPGDLICTHPSGAWDRSGVEADQNLALPLDRLRELQGSGEIGQIAPRHASFQGSITAPLRLMRQTAPEVAQGMADDGVDVVVLTPV
jgi:D-proline reductase (dithiol) PrdB